MSAQPTPEFAVLFRDFMVERIRDEHACTGRVFAELHDGDWRPDPKARSARELAWHLAHSERWFLASLAKLSFEGGGDGPLPATLAEIVNFYDSGFEEELTLIGALTGEQLLQSADFFGMSLPVYTLLNFAHIHTIHHRAQLSTYLRPLGGKVPDIYGGSADTPWQP
ncbi:MAG: DinB family protein [Candidatus Korobacteraceae bacterium]|jgi:uncharacterized damage-inducible protein DinB